MNAKQFAIFKKADKYHSQQMSDTSPNFFPKVLATYSYMTNIFCSKKKKDHLLFSLAWLVNFFY